MKVQTLRLSQLLFLIVSMMLFSCEKDDQTNLNEDLNPFVGSWRESAYPDGSYEEVTFNEDKSYSSFFYDGTSGTGMTENGAYDYSEATSLLTVTSGGEALALPYEFVNSNTLIIDDLTYFKQ